MRPPSSIPNVEMLGPQDGRPIRIKPSQCGIAQFEPVHDDLGHCRVKINNISGASPAAIGVSERRCAEVDTELRSEAAPLHTLLNAGCVSPLRLSRGSPKADRDGPLWQRFGVVQAPAYAFVDDTRMVKVVRGELGGDGLAEHVPNLTSV